ncbi:prepilin-type N-terminal cleavage/methylation domain-containing protein [Thermomonas sp.]|uniref:type IV pilus modification PilV family protein n=1 Tax=Thermomonas sp. TaxID=1971895 RepID=UPI0035B0DE91
MARIIRGNSPHRTGSGFSLIEVMVAVVILATGLLALAALQGALARNSSDAKARAAVMSALTSRMSVIRQAPPAAGTTWTMSTGWVSAAAAQAGTSDLQVVETIEARRWNGTGYVTTAVTNPTSTFTRATLTATWTAADAPCPTPTATTCKRVTLASDLSGNIYGLGTGYPGNDPKGSSGKFPIVRQSNPSKTAGVIPIVSGNQATAASNPQPIIEGADSNLRVGTSFDVLNYVPESDTAAKITKRFQTQVIKCRCKYGAAGYSVAGAAQWPAVWNGTTYEVYPGSGAATGVSANAGEDPAFDGTAKGGKKGAGREQSEQCVECCRDQHDAAGTAAEAKYDPEASGVSKYDYTKSTGALTVQTNVSAGTYVAACRVVKVDGLWRTTADMYQRSYGLLETSADVNGTEAKSGIPSSAATGAYQAYVKDYLSTYTKTATTAPGTPQVTYDAIAALNAPATINIATPSTTDYRYLHARGLYVDYLGTKAQKAIEKCDGKSGTAYTECLLPVLPFTTINLTEIAKWTPSDPNVLAVNTNNTLYFNVTEPSGGRTAGIKAGTATSNTQSRRSNSGVAVSDDILAAVDDQGDIAVTNDSQQFVVGSGSGGSGNNYFWTRLIGAGASPGLTHTYGNCGKPGSDYQCTSSATLPQDLTLTISKYYKSGGTYTDYAFGATPACTPKGPSVNLAWVAGTYSVGSYNTLQNVNISGVTLWDGSTLPSDRYSESGVNAAETATLTLTQVPAMAATGYVPVTVSFANDGSEVRPTVKSCVYDQANGTGGNKYIFISSVVWNETWATVRN